MDVYLFIYFCFLILFCENVTLSGSIIPPGDLIFPN